jgi:hypothetical protein
MRMAATVIVERLIDNLLKRDHGGLLPGGRTVRETPSTTWKKSDSG